MWCGVVLRQKQAVQVIIASKSKYAISCTMACVVCAATQPQMPILLKFKGFIFSTVAVPPYAKDCPMTTTPVHPPAFAALSNSVSAKEGAQNHLIEMLPAKDRKQLMSLCQPVHLVLGDVLCEPRTPTRFAYFPVNGFVSLIATSTPEAHDTKIQRQTSMDVEVGIVGREGMLGAELVLDVMIAPLHGLVQGAGWALRVETKAFKRQLAVSEPLRSRLLRYVYVLMAQQATAASCLRFHQIAPRLARWLLMSHDRAHSNKFYLTQEFLAHMLGVRRVGITAAARALQSSGLISYRRGELYVLDRHGLEAAACTCYEVDQKIYNTVL